jgi:hypothetical protein
MNQLTPDQEVRVIALHQEAFALAKAGGMTLNEWIRLSNEIEQAAPGYEGDGMAKYFDPRWRPELQARVAKLRAGSDATE